MATTSLSGRDLLPSSLGPQSDVEHRSLSTDSGPLGFVKELPALEVLVLSSSDVNPPLRFSSMPSVPSRRIEGLADVHQPTLSIEVPVQDVKSRPASWVNKRNSFQFIHTLPQ